MGKKKEILVTEIFAAAEAWVMKKAGTRSKVWSFGEDHSLEVRSYDTSTGQRRSTWMIDGHQCPKMGVKSLLDMVGREMGEEPKTRKVPYTMAAKAWEKKHGLLIPVEDGSAQENEEGLFASEKLESTIKKKVAKALVKTVFDKKQTKETISEVFADTKKATLSVLLAKMDRVLPLDAEELIELFGDL